MKPAQLTTIDNPFNPFTNFDEWRRYDESHGYYSLNYLARIVIDSPELSDADETLAINQAIDEIVEMNINGLYKKVYEEDVIEVKQETIDLVNSFPKQNSLNN